MVKLLNQGQNPAMNELFDRWTLGISDECRSLRQANRGSPRPCVTGKVNHESMRESWPDSGRFAMVILEKPAQALAAGDDANLLADLRPRFQDLMIQSLVRSFAMIMKQEFRRGVS